MVKVAQSNKFMRGSSSFGMNQKDTAEHKSPHFLKQNTHPSLALRMETFPQRRNAHPVRLDPVLPGQSKANDAEEHWEGFIFFSVKKPDSLGNKKMRKEPKKNSWVSSGSWIFFFLPRMRRLKHLVFFNYMPDLGEPTNVSSKVPAGKGDSWRFVSSQEGKTIHG